jgi:hypothetical protein
MANTLVASLKIGCTSFPDAVRTSEISGLVKRCAIEEKIVFSIHACIAELDYISTP